MPRIREFHTLWRPLAAVGALTIGSLLTASPVLAEECKFAPADEVTRAAGIEPQLLIDGDCVDPDYNESTFVIEKTEQLTFQVPDGGPLIPYTQITGHFPPTRTVEDLPPGIRQSPTTIRQDYVFRFPAKEFWRHRSFLQQHPTVGGAVSNRMAFTNGALSISWGSAALPNIVATHRHQAAATKLAKTFANRLYGDTAKVYSYFWGCSGGGAVAVAAAENTVGVWDGVQPQCTGTNGDVMYHSFFWQAHYVMALPQEKRDAISAAAAPGGTGDIYAGLNDEEKAVLTEFISAGYPLPEIRNHYNNLLPLVDPIDMRLFDPTYEDDFWSKPGYAGVNPPNYLKAAKVDGWATITGITRDSDGRPTAVQFDPATVPALGTIGDSYLEFWVYGPDGKTRVIDPVRAVGGRGATENKRRFSLVGNLDPKTGVLALTGTITDPMRRQWPIINSPVLLDALKVGDKVRINNRFILAMYFYPRYSNVPGSRSHDQYRNADGSPKYPQREDISSLAHNSLRVMGGRLASGDITAKTMGFTAMADHLAWPIFNVSYAEQIQRALGPEKADQMLRIYLHDNGNHSVGGGEPGIFQQSMQDMMAWVEQGVAPPKSTQYAIRSGQVILAPRAADRHGLQPVMNLTANGTSRAEVGVNQPVNLAARLEMPPGGGQIVQYMWAVDGKDDSAVVVNDPQPLVNVARTISFDKPGVYLVRLTIHGQRDGQLNPANQTLMRNYQDVQVVVR
jgi:hypothetical protein